MPGRPTGSKRDRERSKKLKADEKRAKRQEDRPDEPDDARPVATLIPAEEVIAKMASLQASFDDEQISFDEYEETKASLLAQLVVE